VRFGTSIEAAGIEERFWELVLGAPPLAGAGDLGGEAERTKRKRGLFGKLALLQTLFSLVSGFLFCVVALDLYLDPFRSSVLDYEAQWLDWLESSRLVGGGRR
jgi:hypothetical protein